MRRWKRIIDKLEERMFNFIKNDVNRKVEINKEEGIE